MNKLRQSFGDKCQECGKDYDLEFAHIKPTELKGKSRGRADRYHDIKKNSSCYKLLCSVCHKQFDDFGDEPPF